MTKEELKAVAGASARGRVQGFQARGTAEALKWLKMDRRRGTWGC